MSFAGKGKLAEVTKEALYDLYVVQNKTDREIAALFSVTDVALRYKRLKLGIQTKSQLARRAAETGRDTEFDRLTPVQLAELYSVMGAMTIAKRFAVSKPTVRAKLKKFGITSISKSERATSHQELTPAQKDFCIGTLLGDGHILSRGVLKVSHYQGQLDYLLHSHHLLKPLVLPVSYSEKEMDNGQLTFAFEYRTCQHSWFQALRAIFYPEGKKEYPPSILQALSPASLAYWYFDDGHLDSGLPSFALGVLSNTECERIIKTVGSRFGLDTYEPAPAQSCRKMGIRARAADTFFSLIREYATPDLLYKLPPKHWPKGTLPRLPSKTETPNLLPKHLSDAAKRWNELNDDDREAMVSRFTDYWLDAGFPHHVPKPEELETLFSLDARHVIQNGKIKIRQVGQSICQGICQNIWSAHSYGSNSPAEVFTDRTSLQDVIRFCLKMGDIPNQSRLRAALRYHRRNGVYNFRPSAAKALIDRYCRAGGTVLDPCAGYGGRLLGALTSAQKPVYVGYEPATATYTGLRQLHTWISQYVPDVRDRVTLYQQPAEEAVFPSCDMVLTSPPYWKREVYCQEPTQSGIRYKDYETWLNGFWRVVLEKGALSLHPGGWLVLNVDDFSLGGKDYSLINDTRLIVEALGFYNPEVLSYEMPGGSETVLCWAKGSATKPGKASEVQSLVLPKCQTCGKTKPTDELLGSICHQCRSLAFKPCHGCGITFKPRRKDHLFHNEACYARYRRKHYREGHPVTNTRTFTCTQCLSKWQTSDLGHFTLCPSCKELKEVEHRKKVCAYRHCGATFTDTSPKNSMKFCRPDHRYREKAFRSGKATDLSYFRN